VSFIEFLFVTWGITLNIYSAKEKKGAISGVVEHFFS
jgi:hypothetical protein